jgi:hypothetical protein
VAYNKIMPSQVTGRKLKLTEERHDKIVEFIKAGNYASQAAGAAGIGERTFWRWMKQGEDLSESIEDIENVIDQWNEMSYAERVKNMDLKPRDCDMPSEKDLKLWHFWRDIKKAESEAEANLVSDIKEAGKDSWQALAWILERKHKDRWGRTDNVNVKGAIDHQHKHSLLSAGEAEVEAARQKILESRKQNEINSGESGTNGFNSQSDEQVIDAEIVE